MTTTIHTAWMALQATASDVPDDPVQALAALHAQGMDRLPMPGNGATLARWQMLASVSAFDLGLAKLYEAHTDALAILAELSPAEAPPPGIGGVWAAEAPGHKLLHTLHSDGQVTLSGKKAWCSGAGALDWALITTWDADNRPFLSLVDGKQTGMKVDATGWRAVGMSRALTSTVSFEQVGARTIGQAGAYLDRPGFWHGGAGIAACWYGAAVMLADTLARSIRTRAHGQSGGASQDPYRLAHMGAVDVALAQARALLLETAREIDAGAAHTPHASQQAAMRIRAACEAAATKVLEHVGKALGATPFCTNARFARMAADLPVWLRQSHAEQDLAALAMLAIDNASPWTL